MWEKVCEAVNEEERLQNSNGISDSQCVSSQGMVGRVRESRCKNNVNKKRKS